MEENIKKGSLFVSHFEAIKQIPDVAEQAALYEAIFNYQFYGTMPENLPPIANILMTAILPVLEKDVSHKSGGRLEKVGAKEVAAKVKELGGKKAAAAYFGVSERTIYNKLAEIEKTAPEIADELHCNFSEIEENNVERRKKNEERRMKEGGNAESAKMQEEFSAPPDEPQCDFVSAVSLPLSLAEEQAQLAALTNRPSVKMRKLLQEEQEPVVVIPSPSVEEVSAYIKKVGAKFTAEAFISYYAAVGWRKRGELITNWRAEIDRWVVIDAKKAAECRGARASPQAGAAASCDREWNSNRVIF